MHKSSRRRFLNPANPLQRVQIDKSFDLILRKEGLSSNDCKYKPISKLFPLEYESSRLCSSSKRYPTLQFLELIEKKLVQIYEN